MKKKKKWIVFKLKSIPRYGFQKESGVLSSINKCIAKVTFGITWRILSSLMSSPVINLQLELYFSKLPYLANTYQKDSKIFTVIIQQLFTSKSRYEGMLKKKWNLISFVFRVFYYRLRTTKLISTKVKCT